MDFVENGLIPIIAILSTVALPIGFGMYLALKANKAKHVENMELIKQGIVPVARTSPTPNRYISLRNGILCIGIGLGCIAGLFAFYNSGIGDETPAIMVVIAAPILIFLGLAYVLFYWITKDKNLEE